MGSSEVVLHYVDPLLLAVGGDPVSLVAGHHADVVGEPPLDPRVEPSDQVRPLPEIHQSVVAQQPAFGCDRCPWKNKDRFSKLWETLQPKSTSNQNSSDLIIKSS